MDFLIYSLPSIMKFLYFKSVPLFLLKGIKFITPNQYQNSCFLFRPEGRVILPHSLSLIAESAF